MRSLVALSQQACVVGCQTKVVHGAPSAASAVGSWASQALQHSSADGTWNWSPEVTTAPQNSVWLRKVPALAHAEVDAPGGTQTSAGESLVAAPGPPGTGRMR